MTRFPVGMKIAEFCSGVPAKAFQNFTLSQPQQNWWRRHPQEGGDRVDLLDAEMQESSESLILCQFAKGMLIISC